MLDIKNLFMLGLTCDVISYEHKKAGAALCDFSEEMGGRIDPQKRF